MEQVLYLYIDADTEYIQVSIEYIVQVLSINLPINLSRLSRITPKSNNHMNILHSCVECISGYESVLDDSRHEGPIANDIGA